MSGRKELWLRKLRGRSGETIGETLVALLIAALALMMMAGAIQSSFNAVTRGRETLNEYYDNSEEMVRKDAADGTLEISIKENDVNDVKIQDQTGINVSRYQNSTWSSTPVIAYKK